MSRHVPAEFADKVEAVQQAVDAERGQPRRAFQVTEERRPGVRLVVTERAGVPVVFALWTEDRDMAEICGDASYPAAEGLLAIDRPQADDLLRGPSIAVDLGLMVRSETMPGIHYALLDRVSHAQLRSAVERLVPPNTHSSLDVQSHRRRDRHA